VQTPVVLITGGSGGIGRALAHRFARRGMELFLVARDATRLAGVRKEIEAAHGVRVRVTSIDLCEPEAAENILAAVVEAGCYVETLVNCAGVGFVKPFDAAEKSELIALLQLNLVAPTNLMHACLPDMQRRGTGGILNVASLAGLLAIPFFASYSAAKSYLITLTRALAAEVSASGVRVSVVVPGPVHTTFLKNAGLRSAGLLPALSPEAVAAVTFDGYMSRQTVITPGLLGLICRCGIKVMPHSVLTRAIGLAMRPAHVAPPVESGISRGRQDEEHART
jgi:uncharacterized protein